MHVFSVHVVRSFVRHFVLLSKCCSSTTPWEFPNKANHVRHAHCNVLKHGDEWKWPSDCESACIFRSAVWKYYGFPAKDGTADKSKTICKICSATLKYCAGLTSSMSAYLKRQHSIDERSEVLDSKMVKTSPGTKNSTETGQLKSEHIMKNKLHGQATGQRR